jgi:hypothetical protein
VIAVVDYHKGNLKSVERGLIGVGGDAIVTDDPQVLPPLACSECFGRLEGCRLCSNNK